jgi:organic radical activating enzyme
MKTIWENIYNEIKDKFDSVDIVFTGGEVTINKNFLPFISWLYENYNSFTNDLLLTSNGSATTAYYIKSLEYLTHLTLSTHLEWMNERKFFETVLACNDIFLQRGTHYQFKVQLMGEEFNEEFIAKLDVYEKFLQEHDISYSRKKLHFATKKHSSEFNVVTSHSIKSQSLANQFNFGG